MRKKEIKQEICGILIMLMAAVMCSYAYSREKIIDTKKLSWSDFKGAPDPGSPYDSYTYWYVYYEYDAPVSDGSKIKITFRVWNELGKKSWVKFNTPREHEKPQLLNHEQGHYYIGAICALELKRRFREYNYTRFGYHQEIKKIFDEILKKYIDWEKEYDSETRHMYNRQAQKKWDAVFQSKINALSIYLQ